MRINASLPQSMVDELKKRNEQLGQPISWQIRRALEAWFAAQAAGQGPG